MTAAASSRLRTRGRSMPAATQTKDRSKALATALAQIDKSFGKGSVMRLGDEIRPPVAVIPTGSTALDVALGIGGLPRGRIVEIYGPESSGKTTVALHAVASAQKGGGNAAFIDAEHALDPVYAKALGVDIDNLLVSQPDTGEQALEITDMLVRSGGLDIIVIDSVAALVPKAEIEGEMGDSHVGLQARLMSQALRKITGALSSTGTTATFLATKFASRTTQFASFLRFCSTLTLCCKILFNIKIKHVIVRLNSEDSLIEVYLSSGLLTVDIQYANFHYFLIKRVEPLHPATLPFTRIRLCSGITFNTFRF